SNDAALEGCARHAVQTRQSLSHLPDRQVTAVEHKLLEPLGRELRQHTGEQPALLPVIALDVDQQPLLGKRLENLAQSRHQADALPAERKSLAAVGSIAVADVERLQLGEAVLSGDAVTVG